MDNNLFQNMRKEYVAEELNENSILKNPFTQFDKWFNEAVNAGIAEPNAMTLATANVDFKPSARIVLLKGVEEQSFIFFTNYNSRKGKELLWNPYATLLFFWSELYRQVRIEGRVVKLEESKSDDYFNTRPEGSRLGAIASPQSEVIANRNFLEERLRHAEQEYVNKNIPRPKHWGGYRLIPSSIEFWQGRANRLHDRMLFTLVNKDWKLERLAP